MLRRPLTLLLSVLFCTTSALAAQPGAADPGAELPTTHLSEINLPDAPMPNDGQQDPQLHAQESGSSDAQTQNNDKQDQRAKAHAQIKEEEHQRILWVLPAFNESYHSDAVPLTAKEKMGLAFHSATDPMTFAISFVVAGWGEAVNSSTDRGFGWGPEGYAKRAGAKYLDAFNGAMIGNGILPSILRQDPRYFRLGHGSTTHRVLYSIATAFVCKHDNPRRWEPNYSNVGGNLIAGAISNFYYPNSKADWAITIENGMVVTAEGSVGSVLEEFWPDIVRKFSHKKNTHGTDEKPAVVDPAKPADQQKK